LGHKTLLKIGRDRRLHGVQQQVELDFTHGALPLVNCGRSQNGFVFGLNGSLEF
jgi:hypothetical protein